MYFIVFPAISLLARVCEGEECLRMQGGNVRTGIYGGFSAMAIPKKGVTIKMWRCVGLRLGNAIMHVLGSGSHNYFWQSVDEIKAF